MCGWAGSQGGLGAVGVRMEPCDLSQMKSGRECLRLGDRGVFSESPKIDYKGFEPASISEDLKHSTHPALKGKWRM